MGIALYRVHAGFAMVNIAVTFLLSLFFPLSSFLFFLPVSFSRYREKITGRFHPVVNTGSSSLPSSFDFYGFCENSFYRAIFLFLQSSLFSFFFLVQISHVLVKIG